MYPKGTWPVGPGGMYTLRYDPEKDPESVVLDWQDTCFIRISISGDDKDLILGGIDDPFNAELLFDESWLEGMECHYPFLLLEKSGSDIREIPFRTREDAEAYAHGSSGSEYYLMEVDGAFYAGGKPYDLSYRL